MSNNFKNENELETFFNLLNPIVEHADSFSANTQNFSDQALDKISTINDALININNRELEFSEKQVVSKNNSIDEINNNTSLLYNYIYSIFITILVIIILGIITYLKNILNINENMYMTLIILTLLSYIFYIMYLFNIMYIQNSINKIINFIRTGRFELGEIKLGKVPQSVYIQQLCKKKKALEALEEEGENINSKLMSGSKFLASIPATDNNAYFYNDGNAPKHQILPNVSDNKFAIYNVDADMGTRSLIKTTRL